MDQDVEAALTAEMEDDYTVISGMTIPSVHAPTNPPDYDGSSFTITEFGLSETVTVVTTSTETTTTTTTTSVEVEPTATAKCRYW